MSGKGYLDSTRDTGAPGDDRPPAAQSCYTTDMTDRELKSAYELAMERLKRKDREAGVEDRPLTEAQRQAIAEIRNFYEAKLAEREVLHQSTLARTFEPEARAELEAEYRRERERLGGERDRKIDAARRGEGGQAE